MYQMISEKTSKIELIERYGTLTVKQIINEKPPSIAALERNNGKQAVKNAMAVIVADLNQSFGGDISKDDIMEVVTEIRTGLTCNISLEDLYLVCQKIKTSSTYKLKVPTILKAVTDHFNEKTNQIANDNYNKHLSMKFEGERSSSQHQEDADFRKIKIDYLTKQATK